MRQLGSLTIRFVSALGLLGAPLAWAQSETTLSLEEAIRLARERNGTVRAAQADVRAARARANQLRALFYPTVTPAFEYINRRNEIADSGQGTGAFETDTKQSTISANYQILDAGQRQASFDSARRSLNAQEANARQTLREVLFEVVSEYYEALRTQELQKVSDVQAERAQRIFNQTQARVEAGDAAQKDTLQAEADALNARVDALRARNESVAARSRLRATIGAARNEQLPVLLSPTESDRPAEPEPVEALVDEALRNRADLVAGRFGLQAQRANVRRARIDAGLTWSLDGSFAYQITPDALENRGLSFVVSYPLFDGGRRREEVREAQAVLDADQFRYDQQEREARSEIESAYYDVTENLRRLDAAELARNAARRNFEAASESQRLGAGDLIEVLTAQVSLTTAESNYIQAEFDLLIADYRLRLVTGRPIPGE
jgi:outer membrane protein